MKSQHSAYTELPVYITTLNKGRRSLGRREKNEEREEGKRRERTYDIPALLRRPGRIDGARLRVLEDRIRPSTYIPPACSRSRARTYKNSRGLSTSGRSRTPDAAGALSSLRGSLGSFYERSLWKQASCARDKPPLYLPTVCAHAQRRYTIYIHAYKNTHKCVPSRAVRYAHQRKAHKHVRIHRRYIYLHIWKLSQVDTHIRVQNCIAHNHKGRVASRMCVARAVSLEWLRRAKNFRLRSHENVDWSIAM